MTDLVNPFNTCKTLKAVIELWEQERLKSIAKFEQEKNELTCPYKSLEEIQWHLKHIVLALNINNAVTHRLIELLLKKEEKEDEGTKIS